MFYGVLITRILDPNLKIPHFNWPMSAIMRRIFRTYPPFISLSLVYLFYREAEVYLVPCQISKLEPC